MNDNNLKFFALNMYANWLETHDVNIGRNDAIAAGEHKKVRALDTHQLQMVERLRELAEEAFKGR